MCVDFMLLQIGGVTTSYNPLSSIARVPEPLAVDGTPSTGATATPLYTLHPHQYDILLIVDNREHYG